jgi:Xaa-Pro dipeptidase
VRLREYLNILSPSIFDPGINIIVVFLSRLKMHSYEKRVNTLRSEMDNQNLEAVVVIDPVNLYYYTGQRLVYPHTIRFSASLITKDEALLLVPTMEKSLAKKHSWIKDIRTYGEIPGEKNSIDPILQLVKIIKDQNLSTANIGIEKNHLVVSIFNKLNRSLPNITFNDSSELFQELRMIKSKDEIKIVREAARLSDKAVNAAIEAIDVGVTEREVAEAAREAMALDDGYWSLVLYPGTGVAAGPRTAISHYRCRNEKIKKGEFVTMDLCALNYYKGYHVSNSRTAIIGQPTARQREAYDCSLEAEKAAIDAIAPGVRACDVDEAARKAIIDGGFGDYLSSGSGHAIGLHYYEKPYLRFYDKTVLRPGMYFNVSCGIGIPGCFGTICENTVLVTKNGNDLLTKYPLELHIK